MVSVFLKLFGNIKSALVRIETIYSSEEERF